jgi:tryptophan 2,3-dioxygenase
VTAYGKDARVSYSSYLKVPELLSLQQTLADPPAHDELQFIVVHQVYELWFRLVLHELDAVKAALDVAAESGDDTPLRTATRLLKRVETIFKVLVQQIHVLESMRPTDFLEFRAQLNPASGFQSAQFREVECLMGLKDAQLVRRVEDDPRIAALQARFEGDTIPDALYRLLRARGLPVTPPDEHRSEAQATTSLEALRAIYEQPDEHPALYDLCEALVDLDEQLVLWRRHHIMMVERQIGAKPGTGKGITGDLDGIRYLLTTLSRQAVPDLWAVRTVLET